MARKRTDTALEELEERRSFLCRLTPDRALQTLDEAEDFLRDRGLLTRTTDCSLPSLFEACHEDPYAPDKPGFGQWPRTKWSWSFVLASRPAVHALKIHCGKTLYVSEEIARIVDPICRAELARLEQNPESARLLRHLGDVGASTTDDLKAELELNPKELKLLLSPLERCGAIVSRAMEPKEDGLVQRFEYLRWDQIFPVAGEGTARLDDLIVLAVRAAVVATERELPKWFSWRWPFEADLVDRLVADGRLMRHPGGWVSAASA